MTRSGATKKATGEPGVYEVVSETRIARLRGKKIPDSCYYIAYRHGGKLRWERVGWISEGYNIEQARLVRGERLHSMRHGEELPQEKKKAPFLRDVWKEYEKWAKANKAREGRDDICQYENHLKGRFEGKRLHEVSSFDLERLKVDLGNDGLSPASVKHCLVLVRQIYNKAMAWDLYQGPNPIKGVKMPALQNQRTRFLSHEEATGLLNHIRVNPQIKDLEKRATASFTALHDLCLLSLCTGMRAGECFALRGHDIDLKNAVITIRDPKNKTTRHAYMTKAVNDMLKRRKPKKPSSLVFPDRKGKQAKNISAAFRRAVDALGFNKGVKDPREFVTFHTLRHTFASWLAIQGEQLQTIGDLLGHKDLVMTRRYSHLTPDHKRRAVLGLGGDFEKSRNGKGAMVVPGGE